MSKSKFVGTATVRIELSDGDWIEVKEELSYGEQQRLAGGAMQKITGFDREGSPELGLDLEHFTLQKILVWLADWSFTDEQGNKVRITKDAIAALREDVGAEVEAAVDAHAAAVVAARKNSRTPTQNAPSAS